MENTIMTQEEYDIRVTKHGAKRTQERLGLGKKSIDKNSYSAFERGISQADVSGTLSRYMYGLYCQNRTANNIRIYNRYVYIFAGSTLITVFSLPHQYTAYADKIQRKKNAV